MKNAMLFAFVGSAALLMLISAQAMWTTDVLDQAAAAPRITFAGYDGGAGALVIQGSGLVDPRYPDAPAVEIGGRPAEVISYSKLFVAVRLPILPAGDRTVVVSSGGRSARYEGKAIADALWVSTRDPQ